MNATQMKLANPVRQRADEHEMPFAVLVIGGFDTDLIALLGILNDTDWTLYWNTSRADAVETLRRRPVNVVLCDRDLPDGTWKDVIAATSSLATPPPVIVTARFANERLWAEVLNLNGYDVLTKPFDADEVMREITLAREFSKIVQPRSNPASAA
ncbi:MAG TPA: response regulator [Bryobacteraceae bacterium]|nr:response regulator [Bryobacteraceae bacterium]